MDRRRALLLVALAGCGGGDVITAPANSNAAATIILEVTNDFVVATAYDGDASEFARLDFEADVNQVWTLYYDVALAVLDLEPGLVPQARDDELGRHLPEFISARRAVVEDEASIGFEEVRELSGAVQDFRIARDKSLCASRGGCLVGDRCQTPCPTTPFEIRPPTIQAPEPPEPPSMTPCAPGWIQGMVHDATVCVPPARTASCADGEVQWVDASACMPIAVCPAGRWSDAVSPSAWHVDPTSAGGTGSRASPFGSIQEALAAASVGDTIALSVGTHVLPAELNRDVEFIGACPVSTIVAGPGPLTLHDARVRFAGLALERFVLAAGTSSLALERVDLRGDDVGVLVGPGARMNATRLRLRGGIAVEGGEVNLNHVVIEDAVEFGVRAIDSASLQVADSAIVDVAATSVAESGEAVDVRSGSSALLERVHVQRASRSGVTASNAKVDARDVVVQDTQPRLDGNSGFGFLGVGTATVTLERVFVLGCITTGIFVKDVAVANFNDLVVRGTKSRVRDARDGQGLYVVNRATLTGSRLLLAENRETGVLLRVVGAELTDVQVLDTAGREEDGAAGTGIGVGADGDLTLTRAVVSGNRKFGIHVNNGAALIAEHVTVADTAVDAEGRHGEGIRVDDASLRLRFGEISRSWRAGVRSMSGADTELRDVRIADVRTDGSDVEPAGLLVERSDLNASDIVLIGGEARGLRVKRNADVVIERVHIAEFAQVGVFVTDDAKLRMSEALIENNGLTQVDVQLGARFEGTSIQLSGSRSTDLRLAAGASTGPTGELHLQRFLIDDNVDVGVLQRESGAFVLKDGVVRGNQFGVLLTDPDFDLERTLDGVFLGDNETPIGTL